MDHCSLPAGRPVISTREKTASASESLANNLAANAANGEETVHAFHHGAWRASASRAVKKPLSNVSGEPWLIILSHSGLSNEGGIPLAPWCSMRTLPALLACVSLVTTAAASAETRVFIIANQSDGYGVDQCLAKGDKCGAHAAHSYCRSRDFAQATSYRRVEPDEITGSVPKDTAKCPRGGCGAYVAITCQR